MTKTRILVTGATGLIGRNLLKRISGDISVVARSSKDLVKLRQEFPGIKIIKGSISDEKLVKKALKNVDIVYHLAALRAVGEAEQRVDECINTNLLGTLNILKHFKGDRFVTLSTDKAVQVSSTYGASKFIVERLVRQYREKNKHIEYYIIRSGNVFDSRNSVISVWKQQLRNNAEISVTDLNATRYFCTVGQIVDFIFKVEYSRSPLLIHTPYLKSISLRRLLKAVQMKYGRARKIKVIGRQADENKHEKLSSFGVRSDKARRYTVKEILKLI